MEKNPQKMGSMVEQIQKKNEKDTKSKNTMEGYVYTT